MRWLPALFVLLASPGCGDDERLPVDAAPPADAPVPPPDAIAPDASGLDAAPGDAADGDAGGADAEPLDGACARIWDRVVVVPGASATASVESGALVLRASDMAQGTPLAVRQTGLTGDFDATFAYEAFVSGGEGAFVQAAIAADVVSPTSFASAAVGTYPVAGVSAGFQGGTPDVDIQAGTTGESGTFRFQRTGSSVTVTAANGSTTATRTGTFGAMPLRIGVEIGSNHGTIAAETSIRVTAFTITGGGGTVASDEFDCDSLRP